MGVSAYVEILAVVLIGAGGLAIVAPIREGNDRELLEIDTNTLRLRKGDQILQSVSRRSIASLQNFVSEEGGKTWALLTAYDDHDEIVAQWHMKTPWSRQRFEVPRGHRYTQPNTELTGRKRSPGRYP